jgi:hypothetical protein
MYGDSSIPHFGAYKQHLIQRLFPILSLNHFQQDFLSYFTDHRTLLMQDRKAIGSNTIFYY